MKIWNYIKSLFLQFCRAYVREFHLILHDGGIILFFTFLPLAYPVIYSLIYNPELVREVKMVVVDHDRKPLSRELVRNLDATQETRIIGYAADLNEAKRAVDSHKAFGILEIPEGFSKKIGNGESGTAVMYCEMSLLLRYRGFLMAATNVSQAMGAEMMAAKISSLAPSGASMSTGDLMPVHNISMGNISNGFDSFIMPGVIILILHQCIVLACGMAGGAKREKISQIGYNPFDDQPSVLMSMGGQMACYLTIMVVPTIWLIHYVPLIFSFPMAGNLIQIFAYILPMTLAAVAIGFCLQAIVYERETIFIIWVATSLVFLFLSGLTWPRYAMPEFWKVISDLLPATWGVEGFIKMNANGATLTQLSDEYYIEWGLAAMYMVFAYFVQRYVMRPSILRNQKLQRI